MKRWHEPPFHEIADGSKLAQASVVWTYSGDIKAEGKLEYLMTYLSEIGTTQVGLERVVGSVGGKQGSFVLRREGTFQNDTASDTLTVVPGTGTGALRGLRGAGTFAWLQARPKGEFTLEYDFAE